MCAVVWCAVPLPREVGGYCAACGSECGCSREGSGASRLPTIAHYAEWNDYSDRISMHS